MQINLDLEASFTTHKKHTIQGKSRLKPKVISFNSLKYLFFVELNQEIFDINDPGELSSLILAMKLQSETMSEIDGVPLQTLLSNIADNNKIFGIPNFYEDQNEIIPGGEVDPDHMTYEVNFS